MFCFLVYVNMRDYAIHLDFIYVVISLPVDNSFKCTQSWNTGFLTVWRNLISFFQASKRTSYPFKIILQFSDIKNLENYFLSLLILGSHNISLTFYIHFGLLHFKPSHKQKIIYLCNRNSIQAVCPKTGSMPYTLSSSWSFQTALLHKAKC